jgi:hypothetical protein
VTDGDHHAAFSDVARNSMVLLDSINGVALTSTFSVALRSPSA